MNNKPKMDDECAICGETYGYHSGMPDSKDHCPKEDGKGWAETVFTPVKTQPEPTTEQ